MKTVKNTKNTNKKFNPMFVVDLTDIESPADIVIEFISAKVDAGLSISKKEFMYTLGYGAATALEAMEDFYTKHTTCIHDDKLTAKLVKEIKKAIAPKTPWYKKLWNWIKKPFVKK